MNEVTPITAGQLQQATSGKPAAAPLEAETAALRESFLQFGRAVESAAGDFDEAALVAKLTRSLAEENQPLPAPRMKDQTAWWPAVLTLALAASALVAIVRIAAEWPQNTVATNTVAPNTVAPTQPGQAQPPPEIQLVTSATWSDPLDEEIASAQAAVERLAGRTSDLDGSLENFGSRLEALSAELESGSL
jgi:hypothetical protein